MSSRRSPRFITWYIAPGYSMRSLRGTEAGCHRRPQVSIVRTDTCSWALLTGLSSALVTSFALYFLVCHVLPYVGQFLKGAARGALYGAVPAGFLGALFGGASGAAWFSV